MMGSKAFDVQEDIIELMNQGKSVEEMKKIIEDVHGSSYVEVVEDVVRLS